MAEPKTRTKKLTGRIWRLGPDGLGYIQRNSTKLFVFTMDQIENWAGDSDSLPRLEGSTVSFELSGGNKVRSLRLLKSVRS